MSIFYLPKNSSKARLREAENARKNRVEIVKALSQGQVSRRELIKWGLFTSAGLLAPIRGLSPFVPSAFASGGGGSGSTGIPTGAAPSLLLNGTSPFTQPMLRFDVAQRNPVSSLNPAPTAMANQTQQPLDPALVGGQTGLTGPIEGRPPGSIWAHQRFTDFPPQVAIEMSQAGRGRKYQLQPQRAFQHEQRN